MFKLRGTLREHSLESSVWQLHAHPQSQSRDHQPRRPFHSRRVDLETSQQARSSCANCGTKDQKAILVVRQLCVFWFSVVMLSSGTVLGENEVGSDYCHSSKKTHIMACLCNYGCSDNNSDDLRYSEWYLAQSYSVSMDGLAA